MVGVRGISAPYIYVCTRMRVRKAKLIPREEYQRMLNMGLSEITRIIGETEYKTLPGEYRYIPLKEKHRLTNISDDELILIEVQCGAYLGEDDIVRLSDIYGRA